MLILECNLDESVVLRNPDGSVIAEVLVQSFMQYPDHTKVRLGFIADRKIRIMRKELLGKGVEKNNGNKHTS